MRLAPLALAPLLLAALALAGCGKKPELPALPDGVTQSDFPRVFPPPGPDAPAGPAQDPTPDDRDRPSIP